ncbi:hypothetical protein [Treponema sp. OMZ 305]|uniref:hypothetical protein n=1 Tax=Treponema sp. OMZ 305 TaxID=1659192 RepID=UPI0020A48E4A|nr:hypothetical protein [Treponema sp. OMZ 305]
MKSGNEITETVSEKQTLARLLPELTQAVENYDIHKMLALFNAIYESCNGQEDNAILIEARNRIEPLLETISIEAVSSPAPVNVGSPFTQPFTARVVITAPEKQFPLDNYPITVLYPSAGTGSALKKELVRTDSDGFLYFTPPTSNRACDGKLFFCLCPVKKSTALADEATDNLSVSFPYKVATTEKRIPSIIAILDYDENNTPIFSGNITATRLLTGLMKRGFSRIGLDEYRELANTDEASVIRAAQTKIGAAVDRFIFGRTYITVETTEDSTFTCTVRADISIWDFKQARKINRFTFTHTAKAKTKAQAISLARTDLGETVIAETFNYSL